MKKEYEEYSSEERAYAERQAIKLLIKEELEKINEIVEQKNQVILNALAGNISGEEYFQTANALIRIVQNFIGHLKELSNYAFENDLFYEKQDIEEAILYLEDMIKEIPLNITDAQRYRKKEEIKEKVKICINQLIYESKDTIEKIKSLLVLCSNKEISYIDYDNFLKKIRTEGTDKISKLKELEKIAEEIGLKKEEIKQLKQIKNELYSRLELLPKKYEDAIILGKKESVIDSVSDTEKEVIEIINKLNRIENLINKYPKSIHTKELYEYGKNILDEEMDKVEELKELYKVVNREEKDLTLDLAELTKKAVKSYKKSNKLHVKADKIYEKSKTEKLGEEEITFLYEDIFAAYDKMEVLQLLSENESFIEFYSKYVKAETEFKEQKKAIKKLKESLEQKIIELNECFKENGGLTDSDYNYVLKKKNELKYYKRVLKKLLLILSGEITTLSLFTAAIIFKIIAKDIDLLLVGLSCFEIANIGLVLMKFLEIYYANEAAKELETDISRVLNNTKI